MNRRTFVEQAAWSGAGLLLPSVKLHTKHVIFIVNGG